MRNSTIMVEDDQRVNQEICQRFVRISCHKMATSRGGGNLRRNLLILHLLQKARNDMNQVPLECKQLLQSELAMEPPPNVMASARRSGSPRSGSPMPRKSLVKRCIQLQQTTPKRWPFNAQRPSNINTNVQMVPQQQQHPQPITPPPVDENVKPNSAFVLDYQALDQHSSSDDDVFVDDKENKESSDEDVEELFLQKVGKSFISPPISPEKPVQKLLEIAAAEEARPLKSKNNRSSAGRRLEFPLPDLQKTAGRRDFFGILLPDSKSTTTEIMPLSDSYTTQIQSSPIHHDSNTMNEKDQEDLPPYLFSCEEPKMVETKVMKTAKNEDRIVPTRLYRNSVSLCFDSEDLKAIETEDYCATDGDYTEEEDETDSYDFGPRFPSFKRRLRKRKPGNGVRNAAVFFLAEKRPKDASDMLMLTNVPIEVKQVDEHCVPSISI